MHYAYGCTKINSTFSKAIQRRYQQPFEAHLLFLKYVLIEIGYIIDISIKFCFQFFHPVFVKTCQYISCNYKLQQLYGILSKFNNISANRMCAKSLLLCLFHFVVSFLTFAVAYPKPNEMMSSYVDCSQVGSPNVSLSVSFIKTF